MRKVQGDEDREVRESWESGIRRITDALKARDPEAARTATLHFAEALLMNACGSQNLYRAEFDTFADRFDKSPTIAKLLAFDAEPHVVARILQEVVRSYALDFLARLRGRRAEAIDPLSPGIPSCEIFESHQELSGLRKRFPDSAKLDRATQVVGWLTLVRRTLESRLKRRRGHDPSPLRVLGRNLEAAFPAGPRDSVDRFVAAIGREILGDSLVTSKKVKELLKSDRRAMRRRSSDGNDIRR